MTNKHNNQPVPSVYFVELMKKYPDDFSGRKVNHEDGEIFIVTSKKTSISLACQQHPNSLSVPSHTDGTHFKVAGDEELLFVRGWVNAYLVLQARNALLRNDEQLKQKLAAYYEATSV